MSDFGDFEDDDAFDVEPADPEQVARKLHALRVEHGLDDVAWERIEPSERGVAIIIVATLLAWLKRQGAHP